MPRKRFLRGKLEAWNPLLPRRKLFNSSSKDTAPVKAEISDLQGILSGATEAIDNQQFDQVVDQLEAGQTRTTCPVCVDKFERLLVDTKHIKEVCELGRGGEDCKEQLVQLSQRVKEYKTKFVPRATRIHHDRFNKGEVPHATGIPSVRKVEVVL